jgi:hypothetical protein
VRGFAWASTIGGAFLRTGPREAGEGQPSSDREYAAYLEDRAQRARWLAEQLDADADEIEACDAAGAEVRRRNARHVRATARRAEEIAALADDAADGQKIS